MTTSVREEIEGIFTSDPTPFPDDDAAEVQKWADDLDWWVAAGAALPGSPTLSITVAMAAEGKTFAELAKEAIQIVKNILGDPGLAIDTALAWADAAAIPSALSQNLALHKTNLSHHWEGAAHDTFAEYLDVVRAGMDGTAASLGDMARNVATTYRLVMDTYEAALEFMTGCAANLISLAALPVSILDAAEIVKGFAESIFGLELDSQAIINDYREAIGALNIDAITLTGLASDSGNITNDTDAARDETLDLIDNTEDWEVSPE